MGAKSKMQDVVRQISILASKAMFLSPMAAETQLEQEPLKLLLQQSQINLDSISPNDSLRSQQTTSNQTPGCLITQYLRQTKRHQTAYFSNNGQYQLAMLRIR